MGQLLCTIVAYCIIRGAVRHDLFSSVERPQIQRTGHGGWTGAIFATAYALVVLIPLYLLFVYPWMIHSNPGISIWEIIPISHLIGYGLLIYVSVLVHLLITVTLAYPLTV